MMVVLVTAYEVTTGCRDEEYCERAWPSAARKKGRPVMFVVVDASICCMYRMRIVRCMQTWSLVSCLHVLTVVCE